MHTERSSVVRNGVYRVLRGARDTRLKTGPKQVQSNKDGRNSTIALVPIIVSHMDATLVTKWTSLHEIGQAKGAIVVSMTVLAFAHHRITIPVQRPWLTSRYRHRGDWAALGRTLILPEPVLLACHGTFRLSLWRDSR
jgi:hypothetical protein